MMTLSILYFSADCTVYQINCIFFSLNGWVKVCAHDSYFAPVSHTYKQHTSCKSKRKPLSHCNHFHRTRQEFDSCSHRMSRTRDEGLVITNACQNVNVHSHRTQFDGLTIFLQVALFAFTAASFNVTSA